MWQALARLFWTASLAILMLGGATSSSSLVKGLTPTQSTSVITSPLTSPFQADKQRALLASHWPEATPDFSAFVGVWTAHSARLIFAKDGSATFDERTYSWCGPGVTQPCDSIDARGNIHPGNNEQMQFSRTASSIAYGIIISSNFHPRGFTVTVKLQPDNTLLYADHTAIALLCGPASPVGTCGA